MKWEGVLIVNRPEADALKKTAGSWLANPLVSVNVLEGHAAIDAYAHGSDFNRDVTDEEPNAVLASDDVVVERKFKVMEALDNNAVVAHIALRGLSVDGVLKRKINLNKGAKALLGR